MCCSMKIYNYQKEKKELENVNKKNKTEYIFENS